MARDLDSEVIVVGSGAAGCWAAKTLTEGGVRVLLMEAGPDPYRAGFFKATEGRNDLDARLTAARNGQHIQSLSGAFSKQTARFYVNDRENPYDTPHEAPYAWIRGRQLGGRLHTWARASLRMSPSELNFRDRKRVPDTMHWPLSYDELASYYDRVETLLGVCGNNDGLPNLPDGVFQTPPSSAPSNDELARRIKDKTGLKAVQNRVAQRAPGGVPEALIDALRTGRLRIQTGAVVRHLVTSARSGQVKGVGYHDRINGTYQEVSGKIVMLCASAFESVRILLNSTSTHHPDGIGGGSGQLGRYVCDHILVGRDGFAAGHYEELNRSVGYDPTLRSLDRFDFGNYNTLYLPDFTGKWGEDPTFPGGYGIQLGVLPPVWWALGFGEMVPRAENRVTLSKTRTDAWGIPSAHIDIRYGPEDLRMISHMNTSLDILADIAGVKAVNPPLVAQGSLRDGRIYRHFKDQITGDHGAYHPGSAIHETGGARMGNNPASSVVNPFCQCWDAQNVFVTDGACMVTPGFQNHTLTIMALAARASDYILRQYSVVS